MLINVWRNEPRRCDASLSPTIIIMAQRYAYIYLHYINNKHNNEQLIVDAVSLNGVEL